MLAEHQLALAGLGEALHVLRGQDILRRSRILPTSGIPVIASASSVSAAQVLGLEVVDVRLAAARASIWISSVIAVRKLATRSGGLDVEARR